MASNSLATAAQVGVFALQTLAFSSQARANALQEEAPQTPPSQVSSEAQARRDELVRMSQEVERIATKTDFSGLTLLREGGGLSLTLEEGFIEGIREDNSIATLDLTKPYSPSPLVLAILDAEVNHLGKSESQRSLALERIERLRASVVECCERERVQSNRELFRYDLSIAIRTVLGKELTRAPSPLGQNSLVDALIECLADCDTSAFIVYDILHSFGAKPKFLQFYGMPSHVLLDISLPEKSVHLFDLYNSTPEIFFDPMSGVLGPYTLPDEHYVAHLIYEEAYRSSDPDRRQQLLNTALSIYPKHIWSLLNVGKLQEAFQAAFELGGEDLKVFMINHMAQHYSRWDASGPEPQGRGYHRQIILSLIIASYLLSRTRSGSPDEA